MAWKTVIERRIDRAATWRPDAGRATVACPGDAMNQQRARIRKTSSTETSDLSPKCISWKDVAASRNAGEDSTPRSNSVRVYSSADKTPFERQNTFPSSIPKPVSRSGGVVDERQGRIRHQHSRSTPGPSDSDATHVRQLHRKSVSEQRGRSPGLQHVRHQSAFRKTDDEVGDANTKAGTVTCKIRITPPNGPSKNGKVVNKSTSRSGQSTKNLQNGSKGSPSKSVDERHKAEDVAGGSRVRSRSRGHQHGMQNAVQKGERQSARAVTGIPGPEHKEKQSKTKKLDEPAKVLTNGTDKPEESKKTTWAQLRSRSIDNSASEASHRRSQLPTRLYRSLDETYEMTAIEPTSLNIEFDYTPKADVKELDTISVVEPMSLPIVLQPTTPEVTTERLLVVNDPPNPVRLSDRFSDKSDGPVSLPLKCDDEESNIMSETSLPHDNEVQLRNRSPRVLGSSSRHFDLRMLAAFQRLGEDPAAKEALEAEGWMSDIEERDENSSSGASRAASEEPPEPDRKSPRRIKPKSVSLGLERLLETPRNISVIAIENHSGSSPQKPRSPGQLRPEPVCPEPIPDVATGPSPAHGGLVRPFIRQEQTTVTRRTAMSVSLSPAKSPPWEKSVTIDTGALTNCHLLAEETPPVPEPLGTSSEDPSPPRSTERRPVKPTSPAPIPSSTPIHTSCRLLRNRPISRSERHLKTTSTPEIRAAAQPGSVKDVRRPWSEVYCEVEARNLLVQSSSTNCQSVPNFPQFEGSSLPTQTTDAGHSFFHRLSSVRATDSMLQKFRKSFSLRFQKTGRCIKTDPTWTPASCNPVAEPVSVVPVPNSTVALPESPTNSTLVSEVLDQSFATDGSSCNVADHTESSSMSSGPQVVKEDSGVFRLGLSALRSSRERKKGKSKQKKEARGSKCNSADSGIQVEATCPSSDGTNEANSAGESPAVVRRRTVSQGHDVIVRSCRHPDSDYLADETLASIHDHEPDVERERSVGEMFQELDTFNVDDKLFSPVRRTPSVDRQMSTPPPIKVRTERIRPKIRRQKVRARLRRSISQPLDLEKMGMHHKNTDHGLSDQEASREASTASSEEDFSSDNEGGFHLATTTLPKQTTFREMYEDSVTFAEALWDHVTIDPEELPFKAGEVIEVTDSSDKDWWWGTITNKSGWFPAAFVRLRVSQEATVEDCILRMTEGTLGVRHCNNQSRKMSISLLSNDQVRANIVREIVTTERDFVRHLKDVVEGYLSQVRRRPDMFSDEHISTVFGNIEDIYQFQSIFLKHLESSINWELPHTSEIGHCFLLHRDRFRIYSEYCNNHPLAVSQLQELYSDPKYIHFFEACRLLQEMIDISLDGFLLTPVQKICKYPLQLAELLKYTRPDHRDYQLVLDALGAMRGVAQLVNERKRRMECLERLIEWQKTIEGWEDCDLIESSSMLIHSGEVTRVTSSWSRDLVLFLFDHTIVYCKKDIIKRNIYVYRGRINLDHCCVFDVEDGKDAQFGITVRNAWKIHCNSRDKWFLFYAKSPVEKSRWLQAFREERQQVIEDRDQGFHITEQAKKAAKLAVLNKSKVKRPRVKIPKGPRPHPDTAVVEVLLDLGGPKTRSGSLPSNLNPAMVVNGNARAIPAKKKGSGWFHFGSGKKSKK